MSPSSATSPNAGGDVPYDRGLLPPGVGLPAKEDPGQLGAHRIVGRITRDAAGTVLLGVDDSGSPAAIRLVPAGIADASDVRARLSAEVDRLVRVRSLCTAAHQGADVLAAEPWLAAAYAPGRTLAEHVAEYGPLTGGMLTALAAGLAESLAAWHAVGALHLALDPAKVVLSPDGPRVVDLGISRAVGRPISAARWAAPERSVGSGAGAETADTGTAGHADVFAWGALVRFAATGWEPSGKSADEPELGAVPDHLAPLVRRALATDPGQRPTASDLLRDLTGSKGEDSDEGEAGAVSALLAAEWTGIIAPEPRRVSRVRTPALMAVGAAVLVLALLGGWVVVRPGEDGDRAEGTAAEGSAHSGSADSDSAAGATADGDTADGDTVAEPEEDPSNPTVAEDPEDVDAVVAEAIGLALGASSFTTYEFGYHSAPGDSLASYYLQTWDPEPAILRNNVLIGGGIMAMGEELEEIVHFRNTRLPPEGAPDRVYFLNDTVQIAESENPRRQWEGLVETVRTALESVELTYEGTGVVPTETEFLPAELSGEELADRTGHRYTAVYVEEGDSEFGDVEGVVEFWVGEAGHPLHFDRHISPGGLDPDTQRPNVFGNRVEFARFDEPVDLHVPDESEILPERP